MKILASDFDGTLYFEGQGDGFLEEDIKAIKEFQSKGHKFGVCTGRPLNGIVNFMTDAIHLDFYITNSGACIYDENKNILLKNVINHKVVEQGLKAYPKNRTVIMCEDKVYVRNDHDKVFGNRDFAKTYTNQDLSKETILGFSFHFDTEADAKVATEALSQYDDIIAFQNIKDVDCVKQGCSKETGIVALQKMFDIKDDDVACIGDSYNDVPMLKAFKNSFTFDYSPKEVQSIANYTVDQLCTAVKLLIK